MSSFFTRINEAIKGFRLGDPKYGFRGNNPRSDDAFIRIRIKDLEELMRHYKELDDRARKEHDMTEYFGGHHTLILTSGSDREREGIMTILMMQLAIAGYDFKENTFVMSGRTYLGIRDRNKPSYYEGNSVQQSDVARWNLNNQLG